MQKDKFLHFIAGAIFSALIYVFTRNPENAIAGAVVLGIAKEVYDSMGHGTVEIADAVATASGTAAVV